MLKAVDSPDNWVALGMWRRADDIAEGVLVLADRGLAEPIGVLGRVLWEGAVTAEYVRANPSVRLHQLLITALTARRALRNEPWMQELSSELDEDLVQREADMIEEARHAEAAYRAQREVAKENGEEVGRFDFDRAAELPSVEDRARAVGVAPQYLVYRLESAGVHWQMGSLLHVFSSSPDLQADQTPEWRLAQVLALATGSYVVLISQCMQLLSIELPTEFSGAQLEHLAKGQHTR